MIICCEEEEENKGGGGGRGGEEEERNEPFCFHLCLQTLIKHDKNLEDWDFLKSLSEL